MNNSTIKPWIRVTELGNCDAFKFLSVEKAGNIMIR